MDDDRKNFTRKGGPKPGGFRKGKAGTARPLGADGGKKRFGKAADSAGEKKPFRAGPRREDAKPFEKRPRRDGDDRPRTPRAESAERREWKPRTEGEGGERKPFVRREGVRSFGSKSHVSKDHEGPRRSYGMKSHDEGGPGAAKGGGKPPFRRRSDAVVEEDSGERIAKRLARAGIASRRDAEDLITAGRVTVNGRKLDTPAFNVSAEDRIEVDGTAIPAIERTRLFLFHKPGGVVTTNRDPEGRRTVFDVLPTDLPRLMTVGRLDINTEGLLLLTNDGGLARVLELPATGWLRRYRVRVHGKVEEKALAGLKDGISVDGVFYGAVEASLDREQGTNAWLSIGLREGKNREVRNILGALGLEVTRLIRISYGPFQLADLPEGHVLEVKGRTLRDQLGERLIDESGANFEAEVVNQFPNQPVKRTAAPRAEPVERPKIVRDGDRGRIGEGGLIKKRHRRENARDDALGRLSTRPERPKFERGERPERFDKSGPGPARGPARAGRKPEREQRPIEPPSQRKANVWMAPGARPIGAGRAAAEKAEVEARRSGKKPFKAGGKPGFKADGPKSDGPKNDRPKGERPKGERPDRPKGGPRTPRGRDADRRR